MLQGINYLIFQREPIQAGTILLEETIFINR
jgi:hypothetical protein